MNLNKEIINYLIFGVLTTLVNIITFWVLDDIFAIDYRLATTIAWFFSVVFAYVTNKLYVFNSKDTNIQAVVKEFVSFIYFRFLSLILDIVIMVVCIELILINNLIAKIIANVLVVLFNYFASKFIIFKKVNEETK